jgi:hypothetical protein
MRMDWPLIGAITGPVVCAVLIGVGGFVLLRSGSDDARNAPPSPVLLSARRADVAVSPDLQLFPNPAAATSGAAARVPANKRPPSSPPLSPADKRPSSDPQLIPADERPPGPQLALADGPQLFPADERPPISYQLFPADERPTIGYQLFPPEESATSGDAASGAEPPRPIPAAPPVARPLRPKEQEKIAMAYAPPTPKPQVHPQVQPEPSKLVDHRNDGVLTMAEIGRLKSNLRLTPDQEPYWRPVQAELLQIGRLQMKQINNQQKPDVPQSEFQRLYYAARPLLAVLRPDQKERVRGLCRSMGYGSVASMI